MKEALKKLIDAKVAFDPKTIVYVTGTSYQALHGIVAEVGEQLLSIKCVCQERDPGLVLRDPEEGIAMTTPKAWVAVFYVPYEAIKSITFDMPVTELERTVLFGEPPTKTTSGGLSPQELRELGLE